MFTIACNTMKQQWKIINWKCISHLLNQGSIQGQKLLNPPVRTELRFHSFIYLRVGTGISHYTELFPCSIISLSVLFHFISAQGLPRQKLLLCITIYYKVLSVVQLIMFGLHKYPILHTEIKIFIEREWEKKLVMLGLKSIYVNVLWKVIDGCMRINFMLQQTDTL